MKKRFLAWILALVMIVSLLPTAVLAEDGTNAAEPVAVSTLSELQNALNAAADAGSGNTTIDLNANITLGESDTWTSVTVDGYHGAGVVTLNGNNHTITGLNAPLFKGGFAGVSGIVINDLTLKNVNLNDTGSDYASTGFGAFICAVDSMQTIKLKNCHVDGGSIVSTSGARVGGLIGWTSGYNKPNDGPVDTVVAIENCSVKNLTIEASGSVGGLIGHAGANPATYHTLTDCKAENCTLKSKKDGSSNYVGALVGTANVGQVTVTTCTASGNKLTQNNASTETQSDEILGRAAVNNTGLVVADNKVVAAAEMYGVTTGDTVPDTLIKNANGKWEVLRESTVAMIGTAQYASLAEAITAAQKGDTIKLLKDVTETVTIPADKDLTLDLNGKNITVSSGCAIVNKGKLTVTGSGDVTAEQAAVANFPGASAALNGGTYSSAKWYVIKNLGEMVIDGPVTVKKPDGSTDPSSLIDNGWFGDPGNDMNQTYPNPTSAVEVKLTIKSGDFTGEAGSKSCSVVKNDDYGVLVITGGRFDSRNNKGTSNATTILNWNVATISGGTFIGMYPISNGSYDNGADQGILTITGGTFDAPAFGGFDYTLVISGGTFNVDPTDYLADGYIVKKLDDGTWGVSEKEPEFPSWITALPALDGSKKLPFTDVWRGDWYYDGVRYVYDNDLMNGTSGTVFSPNAATTRGMIVTILARMDGVNTSGTPWYEAGREWAMRNGISDGTNMEGKITREQLAAMLSRYAALKNRDVSAITSISAYVDASGVSSWAVNAMRWAVGEGLIQGSNNHLRPQSNATRAEVATILMRFCELLKK